MARARFVRVSARKARLVLDQIRGKPVAEALATLEYTPRAAARLVEMGVVLACVTLGEEGALLRRGADVVRVPAERVEVVDTTGAGDAFVAGLLSILARAGPLERSRAPSWSAPRGSRPAWRRAS